ncbi:Ribosomal RNA-processing protein 8 [Strongyloides ratti]|uniref:Ribosomal RNA-processing protein 8 n=1 Tax=Strongyloides ratti TaxID=34506 RepID=A0A090LB80_STRRB|nr:Ribosomal RNA-processing protein 8 [Strongyloides ratti]CEF67017.1 Ribosomal RNA-processing protein 8 [Strongyloides ratti]
MSTSKKTTDLNIESTDTNGEKKIRKRPWRNRVRMLAKKRTEKETIKKLKEAVQSGEKDETELSEFKASVKRRKKNVSKSEDDLTEDNKIEKDSKSEDLKKLSNLEDKLIGAQFRFINEKLYKMRGNEAYEFFNSDPEQFAIYHDGYRHQVKKWPINPVDRIIQMLRGEAKGKVIADMGCGDAKIAKELGKMHKIWSFDLQQTNEYVTPCNMSHVPLEDESVDIVVYCLSLMGTNLASFLKEANRILKSNGQLIIAEVVSRFKSIRLFTIALGKLGFEVESKKILNNFFSIIICKKSSTVKAKRPFGLKLEPCLYKKR